VSELAYCGTDVEVSDVYGPWDGGWGFGMMLVMLLFLALIVVGIVFVVRSFSDGGRMTPRSGNRALDILDERFARGELDREEYEERRRTLTEGR
jgi:putative membrane protein